MIGTSAAPTGPATHSSHGAAPGEHRGYADYRDMLDRDIPIVVLEDVATA